MNDIHSHAEAYAVGGLEADEAAEFEAHLSGCADCREEVAALSELTARLSEAVATDPPPALRAAILSEIAATAQDAPVGRHAAAGSDAAPDTAGPPSETVVPIRRSWGARASALVAAAAVLAAIAVGAWAIQDRNDARDDTAAANAQVAQLTSLLSAPDVQTATVQTSDGGAATVVRSSGQGVAMLLGSDLPDLPSGKVYEAWTFDGDTPVAAGTFTATGEDTMHVLPPAGVDTSTVAVTVEPEGGSDAPTSDPVVVVDLS